MVIDILFYAHEQGQTFARENKILSKKQRTHTKNTSKSKGDPNKRGGFRKKIPQKRPQIADLATSSSSIDVAQKDLEKIVLMIIAC